MTLDLDTFLTALYTIVDDLYNKHYLHLKPRRPGRRPRLSDSEVLTLAICAQWSGTSERAFIRHASEYWLSYFPRLLSQSAYNRRFRDMTGLPCCVKSNCYRGAYVASKVGVTEDSWF